MKQELKIRYWILDCDLFVQVLEQDPMTRGGSSKIFCSSEGFYFRSISVVEILPSNTLYLRGNTCISDFLVAHHCFDSKDRLNSYVRRMVKAVREYNGVNDECELNTGVHVV